MLNRIAHWLIRRAERQMETELGYVHAIAGADVGLLMRYNRIFGLVDPCKHTPREAYHLARMVGAKAADCGSCVELEVTLARRNCVPGEVINAALTGDFVQLPEKLQSVYKLAHALTHERMDDPDSRAAILQIYGLQALVELSFAMNGAALLPGIKRSLGFATSCDPALLARLTR